jgi:hypothetical protein
MIKQGILCYSIDMKARYKMAIVNQTQKINIKSVAVYNDDNGNPVVNVQYELDDFINTVSFSATEKTDLTGYVTIFEAKKAQ